MITNLSTIDFPAVRLLSAPHLYKIKELENIRRSGAGEKGEAGEEADGG